LEADVGGLRGRLEICELKGQALLSSGRSCGLFLALGLPVEGCGKLGCGSWVLRGWEGFRERFRVVVEERRRLFGADQG
jgi:hypothetical protein